MIIELLTLAVCFLLAYIITAPTRKEPPHYTDREEQEALIKMDLLYERIYTPEHLEHFRRVVELFKKQYAHTTMGLTDYYALLAMYRDKNEAMFPETLSDSEVVRVTANGELEYRAFL